MDKVQILNDDDLRVNGIEALNQILGPTLLSLLSHDKIDYIEISRRLYENQLARVNFKDEFEHFFLTLSQTNNLEFLSDVLDQMNQAIVSINEWSAPQKVCEE